MGIPNENNRSDVENGITLKATADGSWLYRYVKSHRVYYQVNEKGFLEYWTGAKWLPSKYAYNFTAATPQQEAALQELAEIAQEYNMGYGESENNRSKFENDTSVEGLWD